MFPVAAGWISALASCANFCSDSLRVPLLTTPPHIPSITMARPSEPESKRAGPQHALLELEDYAGDDTGDRK